MKILAVNSVSGVFEGAVGHQQAQKLRCIGGFYNIGRDTECGWVESYPGKEATPVAIDMVFFFGIGIEVVVQMGMGWGRIADGVYPLKQKLEVGLETGRTREETTDTDDSHIIGTLA